MSARITDKILEIETYLKELETIMPKSYSSYEKDLMAKAACERYFEKITESLTDLAYLVIKDAGLSLPEDDKEAFSILEKSGHIDANLSQKLKEAKGMRNLIAHEYGSVDDELVFDAITSEIIRDSRLFLKAIKKRH
ncbi:DUF86 domain-containing protein [Candidatus Micrarchaeota archaeon]|nr:DUF86 domain-containing protein [Candidatus Micrarchaeota archaeon]